MAACNGSFLPLKVQKCIVIIIFFHITRLTPLRFGQFFDKAVIDGRERVILFHLNDDRSVSALLPHFWKAAGMTKYFVFVYILKKRYINRVRSKFQHSFRRRQ